MSNFENMNIQEEVENIHVFIRVRPFNKREIIKGYASVVSYDEQRNALFLTKSHDKSDNVTFRFDKIFMENSSQCEIYHGIADPIVDGAFEGYNGTIFAYGQTGSGKSYTISNVSLDPQHNGLIANAATNIFKQISHMSHEKKFVITVTYLEIYNEQFRDLLMIEGKKKLELREHRDFGPHVTNLTKITVDCLKTLMKIFNAGSRNRTVRSTEMNEVSSRSHAIFSIYLESKDNLNDKTTLGKLNFVDLAGSERTSRTKASGDGLREACNINLSLMVLGNVISALVDGKCAHIPYRNSKLTRLLQNSLGGNSKTAMIAMISPCEMDLEETRCTLYYATRVKYIKNRMHKNEGHGYIQEFEREIQILQEKVFSLSGDEENNSYRKQKSKTNLRAKESSYKCEELRNNQTIRNELLEKISSIQKKLIVGGENMYEKMQEQTYLLETSVAEIENLDKTNQDLEDTLTQMGITRVDVEEKYADLQEEDKAIREKIELVQKLLGQAKSKYAYEEHEYQRDIENLHNNKRMLTGELELSKLIVDKCIPKEYQDVINSKIYWDDENQEITLNKIAFTANNVKEKRSSNVESPQSSNMKNPYYQYRKKNENKRTKSQKTKKTIEHIPNVNTYEEFVANIQS